MTDTYTKLFRSIAASTIVSEPLATRWLWVTLLSQSDKNGCVWASIPGLARMANISLKEVEAALKCFLSADPYSRTSEHEGRRIEVVDGGWRLLNHAKYDSMRSAAERSEYKRHWDRENRPSGHARSKESDSDSPTTVRQQSDQLGGQSDSPIKVRQSDKNQSDSPTSQPPVEAPVRQSDPTSHFSLLTSQEDQEIRDPSDHSASANADAETEDVQHGKGKSCPQQAIIAAYHDLLPELPPVNDWPEMSAKHLRNQWRRARDRQTLDWWRELFGYVRRSEFLMGDKTDFQASLGWIVKPANFAKIVNGNYDNRDRASGHHHPEARA